MKGRRAQPRRREESHIKRLNGIIEDENEKKEEKESEKKRITNRKQKNEWVFEDIKYEGVEMMEIENEEKEQKKIKTQKKNEKK